VPKQSLQTRTIESGPLYREFALNREAVNEEERTVELSFSSEEPVGRWFGNEILDHSPGSVRLARLRNGGAILMDHDRRDQVGVVKSVEIGTDRKGRSVARFGKSARAEEIFQDVKDGIRTLVSVGYRIYRMILEKTDEDDETYRAMDWEPYEISIVSIPADTSVGVGRDADNDINQITIEGAKKMPEKKDQHTPATDVRSEPAAPVVDVNAAREEAKREEAARIREITAIGEMFDMRDMATEAVNGDTSVADFRKDILEKMGKPRKFTPVAPELNDKENRQYSILSAIRSSLNGGSCYEREISDTIAKKLGRDTEGIFVPTNLRFTPDMVQQRAPLNTGTVATGGALVPTEQMSMIELLRNRMMVKRLGAMVLAGLTGDLAFPKNTGSAELSWVGENPGSDGDESEASFDQLDMSPKAATATTAYTKKLLAQSSPDIEFFVRNDLATINALGLDFAAIAGTGVGYQPTGILNTSGIGMVVGGDNGAAPVWGDIVDLESAVATANADVGTLAYLTNAKTRGKLKQTVKAAGTAQFIWQDGNEPGFGMMNGYTAGASNQVPRDLSKGTANAVCSAIIFGNWADLMIGEWGVVEILADPYSKKKQGLIEVTSYALCDIGIRHEESFAVMKDALTN
jgi:HK97 family phage major capsid protein/HK97 family phage prohead protease